MSSHEKDKELPPPLHLRRAQKAFMKGIERYGVSAFLARRQYGKTTTLAALALKRMMKIKFHTIIFGSVKLNLSRELIYKEAQIMRDALLRLKPEAEVRGELKTVDAKTGRDLEEISADGYAEIYEQQRMEFRLYHTRLRYSRTKVVALRPDAVGETGDLVADEIGRCRNWPEIWEAIEPIAQANENYRVVLATTPAPDDGHLSYHQLAPPAETTMPANREGNWYRTEFGIWVLRVDAFDADADGVQVFDLETREPLAPAEHRRRAYDKDAWDRNYGVKFLIGGTSAVGLLQLDSAQQRGRNQALLVQVDSEEDFERGLEFLRTHLGPGVVGGGWDLATTERERSNPSVFAVKERTDAGWVDRVHFVWKTRDPQRAKLYAKAIVQTVNSRADGGRMRRLCIDATNERYFAGEAQRKLSSLVPVELVVGSENLVREGQEPISMKVYLGSRLVADLDDNKGTLPSERYLKDDFRRVKRERGSFICETGPNGEHGDTFDASKLALHALTSSGGDLTSVEGIIVGGRRG